MKTGSNGAAAPGRMHVNADRFFNAVSSDQIWVAAGT
jgi:hypothetical protein